MLLCACYCWKSLFFFNFCVLLITVLSVSVKVTNARKRVRIFQKEEKSAFPLRRGRKWTSLDKHTPIIHGRLLQKSRCIVGPVTLMVCLLFQNAEKLFVEFSHQELLEFYSKVGSESLSLPHHCSQKCCR